MRRTIQAWAVHAYTALGLPLVAGAAVLVVRGGDADLRAAFLLLWAAVVVDATDGWFARRVEVARVLPRFDGRTLDEIVDFHGYVSVPLLLLWRAGIPGGSLGWLLLAPLVASAYGFAQSHAKTDDGYFLGFPSLWNVVAFYLFFLEPEPWFASVVLVGFSILTFVPTPYLYPSSGPTSAARTAATLGALWGAVVAAIPLGVMPHERVWVVASMAYPVYYLAASFAAARRRGIGPDPTPARHQRDPGGL